MFAINKKTGRKIVRAECWRRQQGFVSIEEASFEREDGALNFTDACRDDFEVTDTSDVEFADEPEYQGYEDDSGGYCEEEDIELVESV